MSRNRLLKVLLLALAVLPCTIVAVAAIHIWLSGETEMFNWQSQIWPVVALQLAAIAAFWGHASSNSRLAPGEFGNWIFQFIVYIPFGMLSYWEKYVGGQR